MRSIARLLTVGLVVLLNKDVDASSKQRQILPQQQPQRYATPQRSIRERPQVIVEPVSLETTPTQQQQQLHQEKPQASSSEALPSSSSLSRHYSPAKHNKARFLSAMAFLAGISDVISRRRFDAYANMMTGNVIKCVQNLAEFKLKVAFFYLTLVMGYVTGIGLYRTLDLKLKEYNSNSNSNHGMMYEQETQLQKQPIPTCLAAAPLVLGLFCLPDFLAIMNRARKVPLMAIAFGVVNAGATDAGGTITYAMTGHVTKISQALTDFMMLDHKWRKGSRTSARIMVSFISGIMITASVLEFALPWLETYLGQKVRFPFPFTTTMGILYSCLFAWYGRTTLQIAKQNDEGASPLTSASTEMRSSGSSTTTNRRRRKHGNRLDIRMDGWTNMAAGPDPFQD